MNEILEKIAQCVEFGKINKASPYPPNMKDQDGADELAKRALEEGIKPDEILENALIPAMANVGNKFSRKEIYVPQMLMAAKAMNSAMIHLKPFFQSGETKRKGKFIVGTVSGDLHDIGKNLVAMMIEGGGWEVIDLGVDVGTEKFLKALDENPGCSCRLIGFAYNNNGKYEENCYSNKGKTCGFKDTCWWCPGYNGILHENRSGLLFSRSTGSRKLSEATCIIDD